MSRSHDGIVFLLTIAFKPVLRSSKRSKGHLSQQLAEEITAGSADIDDADMTIAELDSALGRRFTLFPKLPLELRRKIWENTIPTGM